MTGEQLRNQVYKARGRPLVVFSLDKQRYALPLAQVLRSILGAAVRKLPGAPAIVRGCIELNGQPIPVVDMRKRFKHPARGDRLFDSILVTSAKERTLALLVDETRGIVDASPNDTARSGLIVLHDLDHLLSETEERAIDEALQNALGDIH